MENGHEAATKADLRELGEQLRSEFPHGFDDLKETLRDAETKLLKAFYSFAESNQTRLIESERESAALKERLGLLERRLTEIERKVNFPGQTQ